MLPHFLSALRKYFRNEKQYHSFFDGRLGNLEYNALSEKDRVELSEMLNQIPGYEHPPYRVNKAKAFYE